MTVTVRRTTIGVMVFSPRYAPVPYPGRAVTRRQIPVGTERAVDVHVAALRSKLGSAGGCIETIRGIGYRFRGAACL